MIFPLFLIQFTLEIYQKIARYIIILMYLNHTSVKIFEKKYLSCPQSILAKGNTTVFSPQPGPKGPEGAIKTGSFFGPIQNNYWPKKVSSRPSTKQ